MFITWIVVTAIQIYTHVQTHQVMDTDYVHLISACLNKLGKKVFRRKKSTECSLESNQVL